MRGKLASAVVGLVLTGLMSANSMAGISWGISVGGAFGHPGPRYRYPGLRYPGFYRPGPYIGGQLYYYPDLYWSAPYTTVPRYYFPAMPLEPAAGWAGERSAVTREGGEARQDVRDLIHLLRFGTAGERQEAARELGRLPFAEVVSALSDSLLRDPDGDVRREAARSLGNIGAEEGRPALRYAARDDPSSAVREAAEQALGQLPPEPYLTPLRRVVGRDRELDRLLLRLDSGSKGERKDAAKKLGDRKDPQAVASLAVALANDPEKDVRKEAAKALGKIGDPSALAVLRSAALHDREKDVRKEAAKAIDKILD